MTGPCRSLAAHGYDRRRRVTVASSVEGESSLTRRRRRPTHAVARPVSMTSPPTLPPPLRLQVHTRLAVAEVQVQAAAAAVLGLNFARVWRTVLRLSCERVRAEARGDVSNQLRAVHVAAEVGEERTAAVRQTTRTTRDHRRRCSAMTSTDVRAVA